MANRLHAQWVVTPIRPPEIHRDCGRCGAPRPFVSSGRVRLNSNGKRVDAWLIYLCAACDRTWNRPIVERAPVHELERDPLEAMQMSTPSWVRAVEFDIASLSRHGNHIVIPPEVVVTKPDPTKWMEGWRSLHLEICAPQPTGLRLDRFLTSQLCVSRSSLQAMHRTGDMKVLPVVKAGLSRKVQGVVQVEFSLAGMDPQKRDFLLRSVFSEDQRARSA